MGKSLPRKCNSCKKTYKTDFVKHAKKCPAGFTEWTLLDRAGEVIPEEKIKLMCNRMYGAEDGVRVDAHAEALTDEARSWFRFKRFGVRACTPAECVRAHKYTVEVIQTHPRIR